MGVAGILISAMNISDDQIAESTRWVAASLAKKFKGAIPIDELESVANYGVAVAMSEWDAQRAKGDIAKYLSIAGKYRAMDELRSSGIMRRKGRVQEPKILSLDLVLSEIGEARNPFLTLGDTLGVVDSSYETIDVGEDFKVAMRCLTARERGITRWLLKGKSQIFIARKYDIAESQASIWISIIREKLRERLGMKRAKKRAYNKHKKPYREPEDFAGWEYETIRTMKEKVVSLGVLTSVANYMRRAELIEYLGNPANRNNIVERAHQANETSYRKRLGGNKVRGIRGNCPKATDEPYDTARSVTPKIGVKTGRVSRRVPK